MRQISAIGTVLLVPSLALFLVVGCSKPVEDKKKPVTTTDTTPETKVVEISTATTAHLTGTVTLKGEVPANVDLTEAMKKHADKATCLMGNTTEQKWVVNGGKVQNVVVFVKPPENKTFKVGSDLKDSFKKSRGELIIIDQPKCQYEPRISAIFVGVQKLRIDNSAPIAHNVNYIRSAKAGGAVGEQMSKETKGEPREVKYQDTPISLECNAHNWMRAKIVPFDHPYFAVTDKDGKFKIENLPIDEDLKIVMWHEDKNEVAGETKKLKAGDNSVELSISK